MEKLRNNFLKERSVNPWRMNRDECTHHHRTPPPSQEYKKLVIDPEKLERTIQKACVPIPKKSIEFIDKVLKPNPVVFVSTPPVTAIICSAKNLNGTPCKCKAKIGKFCAKHA